MSNPVSAAIAEPCRHCGKEVTTAEQKFCPACGEATPPPRIDWHFMVHELEHGMLHLDRGFGYTLKELFIRPGKMLRGYLNGDRRGHVRPLFLIMILGTVLALVFHYTGGGVLDVNEAVKIDQTELAKLKADPDQGIRMEIAGQKRQLDILSLIQHGRGAIEWLNGHLAIALIVLIPFFAFSLKLGFRRFRELNYPEWLVIAAYLTAQNLALYLILYVLDKVLPGIMDYAFLLMQINNVRALVQFFRPYSVGKTIIRLLITYTWYFTLLVPLMIGVLGALLWLSSH